MYILYKKKHFKQAERKKKEETMDQIN